MEKKMNNRLIIGNCRLAPKSYNQTMPLDNRLMVTDYTINLEKYKNFVTEANYAAYSYTHYNAGKDSPVFIKKTLEHFISFDLLKVKPGDVFIDIASHDSPLASIMKKMVGCETYRQDIIFNKGINDDKIGGNASDMPIPANFASALSLNSSFEHFEGNSDSLFIRECERILKPGGRVCIVEFFVSEEYAIMTDHATWEPDIPEFDDGSTVYILKGWRNRFGRFYNWNAFRERILNHLGDMRFSLYNILNSRDFHKQVQLVRAAVIEKPA